MVLAVISKIDMLMHNCRL